MLRGQTNPVWTNQLSLALKRLLTISWETKISLLLLQACFVRHWTGQRAMSCKRQRNAH